MDFNTLPDQVEGLSDDVRNYIRIQTEIFKCNLTEALGRLATALLIVLILALLILALNLFIGMAFVSWYGENVGPEHTGYLLVGGYYLLLAVLAVIFRRKFFLNPIIRLTARIIINENQHEK